MDVASVVIITKLIMMAWRQCGLDIVSLDMRMTMISIVEMVDGPMVLKGNEPRSLMMKT